MAFRFRRIRVASSRTLRGSLQARWPNVYVINFSFFVTKCGQGTITEREGTVQLTSLY